MDNKVAATSENPILTQVSNEFKGLKSPDIDKQQSNDYILNFERDIQSLKVSNETIKFFIGEDLASQKSGISGLNLFLNRLIELAFDFEKGSFINEFYYTWENYGYSMVNHWHDKISVRSLDQTIKREKSNQYYQKICEKFEIKTSENSTGYGGMYLYAKDIIKKNNKHIFLDHSCNEIKINNDYFEVFWKKIIEIVNKIPEKEKKYIPEPIKNKNSLIKFYCNIM